tara:strand:- start:21 stop:338 length:318 start_codon:yes stop_codon:yes gene_type:complete
LNSINKNYFINQKSPKCPACGCKHLYKKKDFNHTLGCLIILVGAAFVPLTYGISLVALFLLDLLLYGKIKDSVECYKCKTEYKNIVVPKNMMSFDHHIAEIYEND